MATSHDALVALRAAASEALVAVTDAPQALADPGQHGDGDRTGDAPPRRPTALVVGALLALLVVAACVSVFVERNSPAVTTPAPTYPVGSTVAAFRLPAVDGSTTVSAPWALRQSAVVLFFASTCRPCQGELRRVAEAVGEGDLRGVRFVGVDQDRNVDVARRFLASSDVRFPVGFDPDLRVSSRLAPASSPAALFVAPSGRVLAIDYGVLSDLQLSEGLSRLPHR